MTLNLQAKNSFFVFDEYGMLTVKSDSLSWRDSIGMTVCAWIAYGRPWELTVGLNDCYDELSNKLCRHPNHDELSSRDHWSYFIIYSIMFNHDATKWIKDIPFMRGLYLWMHSLTGNRLAEFFYYLIYIPGAIIGNIWLRICRCIGRIKPERSNKFWIFRGEENNNPTCGELLLWRRTKWQRIWAEIIFQTIPAYPLHNRGWQLYVMPESKRKERLKRILLKRVGKSNILLRLLFGDTEISQQDIDNYPHMTGFRPGVYLDETCRRTIRELTKIEAEYNTYEKDLIIWLFNKQNHNNE